MFASVLDGAAVCRRSFFYSHSETSFRQRPLAIVLAFPLHPFLNCLKARDTARDLFTFRTRRTPSHGLQPGGARGLSNSAFDYLQRHNGLNVRAFHGLDVGHRLFNQGRKFSLPCH
jgi:hypothetical protein